VEEPDDIGEVVAFLSSSALMMLIGLQHNGLKFQEEWIYSFKSMKNKFDNLIDELENTIQVK